MGILEPQSSSIQDLLGLRTTALELQERIVQLASRVDEFDMADFTRAKVAPGLLPHPGSALANQAADHLQVVIDHAGAAGGETLDEQLAAGRARWRELAAEGQHDHEMSQRLRRLRGLEEDQRLGVHAGFRRYADEVYEETEDCVSCMKETLQELQAMLSSLDSEEATEE